MDIQQIKSLLARYGLSPNHTYGQNFLIDESVLDDMLHAAEVEPGDNVLEIGPGIGNLTRKLLDKNARVVAVEKDPQFLPILKAIKKDFPKTFRYEVEDVLKFNFQKLFEGKYKVVANIPYYITGKILQLFLTAAIKPESITVLMQKEVAENAAAEVGDLSVLSLSVQLFGKPKVVRGVPKESFFPAPKVDSAILHINLFEQPRRDVDEKKLFTLLRACFAGKRKQIHNTLTHNVKLPKEEVEKILNELNISPKIRPQDITLDQWVKLAGKIYNPQITDITKAQIT